MHIGTDVDGVGGDVIDGRMDDWSMWSRALSAAEISQLYNSGIGLQYPFTVSSFFPWMFSNF